VAIQQQMLELQEKEHTDRVMMADLEKFSPWVRKFYIQEKKEIAAKRRMQGGQSSSAHSAEK
jgi:pheromone shutdown protein TraB